MLTPPASGSPFFVDDGATTYAPASGAHTSYGHVAGSPYVYDFGDSTDEWIGFLAMTASVLSLANGDESYLLAFEGSNASDFSGPLQDLTPSWDMKAINPQDLMVVDNVYNGTRYRYGRLRINTDGTSPQIQLSAFIRQQSDADEPSLAEALTKQVTLVSNLYQANDNLRQWMTGTVGGGPNHDGKYPLTNGTGTTVTLPCPAQVIADSQPCTPFEYGAIGSQGLPWGTWPSNPASSFFATLEDCQAVYPFATSLAQEMDWLGVQAAINSGKRIQVDGIWHFKMCNTDQESYAQPIVVQAGCPPLDFGCLEFHYEDMRLITDDTQFVSDPDFVLSSGTPWENATVYTSEQITNAVFGGGQAYCKDDVAVPMTQARFWQFGQEITFEPGRYTISCTGTFTLGGSYGPPLNNNQPAFARISFSALSPGEGGNPFGRYADFDIQGGIFSGPVTQTRQFDLYITETTTAWLTFSASGYINSSITHFGITKWLPNTAFLLSRDQPGSHHYPIPMGLRNFYCWGPGRAHVGVHAFRWKSFSSLDGNLVTLSDAMINGFGTILGFSDGAYLLEFHNVGGGSAHIGIHAEMGTVNAGENIRFYGGGFGNSDIAIHNEGGMEFTFYGASCDYSTQTLYENRGRVEFVGVHLECNVPTDAAKPLFDLVDGGVFRMVGGMFLGANGINTSPCAPIASNSSLCYAEFDGTELYNLTSDPAGAGKGAVMSGPGQLRISSWRDKGNPNIGPTLLSYAPAMDLFGGAGTGEAVSGSPIVAGMGLDPSGIRLQGGSYFVPSAPSTDLINSQWDTSRLKLEVTTSYAKSGTKALKVSKQAPYGVGDGCRMTFLAPVKPGHGILGTISFLFPFAVSGYSSGDHAPLYYRMFWVQQIGQDAYGRPIFSNQNVFLGENDLTVPLDGSGTTWVSRAVSSLYLGAGSSDATKSNANGAPSWATHMAILLDHESLPALSYYIDDFICNLV